MESIVFLTYSYLEFADQSPISWNVYCFVEWYKIDKVKDSSFY
jgi:hypothetical protein